MESPFPRRILASIVCSSHQNSFDTMTPIQSRLLQWSVAIGSLYALTTPNPLESLWSVVLISLVLRWFWWKEQPGIILICLITPFFEIHTTVIEANNYNLTLNTLYEHTGRKTFWISSIGFTSVAAIFHFSFQGDRTSSQALNHSRRLLSEHHRLNCSLLMRFLVWPPSSSTV